MRPGHHGLVTLLVLAILIAGPAPAAIAAAGGLSGRVIRQDLGLLVGWTLRATPLDVGRPINTAIDAGTGEYRFSRLTEGRYRLELVAPDGRLYGPGLVVDVPARPVRLDLLVRSSGELVSRKPAPDKRTLGRGARILVAAGSLAVAAALLFGGDDDPSASPSAP